MDIVLGSWYSASTCDLVRDHDNLSCLRAEGWHVGSLATSDHGRLNLSAASSPASSCVFRGVEEDPVRHLGLLCSNKELARRDRFRRGFEHFRSSPSLDDKDCAGEGCLGFVNPLAHCAKVKRADSV